MVLKNISSLDFFEFLISEIGNMMKEITDDISYLKLISTLEKKEHAFIEGSYDPFTISKEFVYKSNSVKADLIYTAEYFNDHDLKFSSVALSFYNGIQLIGAVKSEMQDNGILVFFTFNDPEVRGKIENIIKGNIC